MYLEDRMGVKHRCKREGLFIALSQDNGVRRPISAFDWLNFLSCFMF